MHREDDQLDNRQEPATGLGNMEAIMTGVKALSSVRLANIKWSGLQR